MQTYHIIQKSFLGILSEGKQCIRLLSNSFIDSLSKYDIIYTVFNRNLFVLLCLWKGFFVSSCSKQGKNVPETFKKLCQHPVKNWKTFVSPCTRIIRTMYIILNREFAMENLHIFIFSWYLRNLWELVWKDKPKSNSFQLCLESFFF